MWNNIDKKYTEEELVGLLKDRREEGFTYLYDHYSGALFGVISTIINDRDLAGDVLQEVFVNIYRRFDQFDADRSRLYTWMARIARNAAIDWVRSKGHRQAVQNQDLSEPVYESAGSAQVSVDHIGIRQLVHKLDDKLKEVVELAYFGGLTQDEISEQLGIPLGTVKTRIRTGLQKLRSLM
jgi:RNA polymerase sigma factor (sigma-70 family)